MWLVKSGGIVTGPFSIQELVAKIDTKEVVAHDEVMSPLSSWKYVREQPELAFAVERARNGHGVDRDDTLTGSATEDVGIMDADFDDYEVKASADEPKRKDSVKTFGQVSDAAIQKKVKSSTRWLWVVVGVILVGLSGTILKKQKIIREKSTDNLTLAELVEAAQDSWKVGDYSRATDYFSRAQSKAPQDPDVNLSLANMLISQEGQTVEARRLLQKLSPSQLTVSEQVRLRTILALAGIVDNDLEDALYQTQLAQQLDESFYPSQINLGTIYQRRGQYDQALAAFKKVLSNSTEGKLVQLLYSRAQLESLTKKDPNKNQLNEIGKQLMDLGPHVREYKQETYFLAAYAYAAAGTNDSAQFAAEQVLDVDPQLTNQHWHNPLISRRLLEWSDLIELCPRIVGINLNLAHMRALSAFCKAKVNRWVDARKDFEEAVTLNERDPLVRAVFGAFLLANARETEAAATVVVNENERFNLPYVVSARVCNSQTEPECAAQKWRQLLKINSESLPALAGVATEMAKSDRSQASVYVEKGLGLSPNYIPLLKLQRDLKGNQ